MIVEGKKKAATLAGPRYVPEKFKPLTMDMAMQEAARRSERQPKLISMASRAAVSNLEGRK